MSGRRFFHSNVTLLRYFTPWTLAPGSFLHTTQVFFFFTSIILGFSVFDIFQPHDKTK